MSRQMPRIDKSTDSLEEQRDKLCGLADCFMLPCHECVLENLDTYKEHLAKDGS